MTATPTEIAASAAIAIRIGISGDEPPSSEEVLAPFPTFVADCVGDWDRFCATPLPLRPWPESWLLCPVPPSAVVAGATFPEPPEDEPPPEELPAVEPDSPDGAEAPPVPVSDFFAAASFLGSLLLPVGV